MVDKIIYTYKFTNIPNIDVLKDDCKVWLTTILSKYDPNRGSKAFSYFSVITKHWFIHQLKKNSTKVKREVAYEEIVRENQHERLLWRLPPALYQPHHLALDEFGAGRLRALRDPLQQAHGPRPERGLRRRAPPQAVLRRVHLVAQDV